MKLHHIGLHLIDVYLIDVLRTEARPKTAFRTLILGGKNSWTAPLYISQYMYLRNMYPYKRISLTIKELDW
jgi:hypothetical protein